MLIAVTQGHLVTVQQGPARDPFSVLLLIYKAIPKRAKRPPARAVVPYKARLAAAAGEGVLEAAPPEGEDPVEAGEPLLVAEGLDEADEEPEPEPELPASVACSMVLLPHRLLRACSHSN